MGIARRRSEKRGVEGSGEERMEKGWRMRKPERWQGVHGGRDEGEGEGGFPTERYYQNGILRGENV
jgi:hypothetical protein